MSILFHSLILLSFLINNDSGNVCINELFNEVDSNRANIYSFSENKTKYGVFVQVDSINYTVTRRYNDSGILVFEESINNRTGISFCKFNYEDGSTKEKGFLTKISHDRIGRWTYYADDGSVSFYNFVDDYKVSFCEFYEIAYSYGYTGYSSVFFFNEKYRTWEIHQWVYDEEYPSGDALSLQVDTMKLSKYQLKGKY